METMRLSLLLLVSPAVHAEPLSDALSAQREAVQALEVAALVRPALKGALRWQRDTLEALQQAYPEVPTPPDIPKIAYSESLVAGLPSEKRDSLLYSHLEKAKVSEKLALSRLKHLQGATLSSMAAENVTMLQTEALHELRDTERLMEKADSQQEQGLAVRLGKLGNALSAEPEEPVTVTEPAEPPTVRADSEAMEAPCNVSSVASPTLTQQQEGVGMCTPAMRKLLGDAFPCDETMNASHVSQHAADGDAALAAIEARAIEAAHKAKEQRSLANETAGAKERKQSEVDALAKAKAEADEKAKNAVDKETMLQAEAYRTMIAAAQARKAGEKAEHAAEHARLERQQKHMEEHERMSIENGDHPAEAARHLAREEAIRAQAETVRGLVKAMVKGTVGLDEPLRNARAAMQRMMEAAQAEDAADRRVPSTDLRKKKRHADSPPDLSSFNSTPAATFKQAVDEEMRAAQKAANEEIDALAGRSTPARHTMQLLASTSSSPMTRIDGQHIRNLTNFVAAATLDACEKACHGSPGCEAYSYCPARGRTAAKSGAPDCRNTRYAAGGCWFGAAHSADSSLAHHTTAFLVVGPSNWVSAHIDGVKLPKYCRRGAVVRVPSSRSRGAAISALRPQFTDNDGEGYFAKPWPADNGYLFGENNGEYAPGVGSMGPEVPDALQYPNGQGNPPPPDPYDLVGDGVDGSMMLLAC